MKKTIVFILALFYFWSSTGATIHLHYCMGKMIKWDLSQSGAKCENCGMEKKGGCCKDEQRFVKNTADQQTTESAIHLTHVLSVSNPTTLIDVPEYNFSTIPEYPVNHPPPTDTGTGIYLLNCVFRL